MRDGSPSPGLVSCRVARNAASWCASLAVFIRTDSGNGAAPTFVVDAEAVVGQLRSLMTAENCQKGPEGRRVPGFTPELLVGPTFFGNRICPFSHRGYWALLEKDATEFVDYVHIDLNAQKPAWFKVSAPSCLPPPTCSCTARWSARVALLRCRRRHCLMF